MNPLSTWTFYRRHKRRAALLLGLIGLVTAGLYLAVALLWAIAVEPMRSNQMYLSKFSMVWLVPEGESNAAVVAQIRANPDVERAIIATHGPGVQLPVVLGGGSNYWNLFALREEDVTYFLERCAATLKEGRLLHSDWDLYDTRHCVHVPRRMSPEQLEEGYWRAYREFYTWRNIAAAAATKPGVAAKLRHAAYSAGWKKFEPVWNLLIRARQVSRGLPMLESVLDGFGRVAGRKKKRSRVPAAEALAKGRSGVVLGDTSS